MGYTATTRPAGWVNNVEVTCGHCHTGKLYINPNHVKSNGGKWTCPHCKQTNGG